MSRFLRAEIEMQNDSPDHEPLRGPVALCRLFLEERVRPGDRVVDATCGNGHDTLFLAGLVGGTGRVWALDIDGEALAATGKRLRQASLDSMVQLVHAGHEQLGEHVAEPLQAVVFNLGYLPGGARDTVTRPETTIAALEQACRLLAPGGIVLLAVYTGHPGGAEEGAAVDSWAAALPSPRYNVWRSMLLNRRQHAPYLLLIEKTT